MMGMFSRIVNFFSSVPKLGENIFDKDKGLLTQVGSWVGGQQFTDQERAEHNSAMVKSVQAFAVATLNENTDRSKARREIARAWFKLQIWLIKMSALAIPIDMLIERLGNGSKSGLFASINILTLSPLIWGITGAVSVFFFGAHIMRGSKWAKESK